MIKMKAYKIFGPGEQIKDELESRNWSQNTLADILGCELTHINEIINNKRAITLEMAEKLGKAFDTSAQLWINLYLNYRNRLEIDKTEKELVEIKSKIFEIMPIRQMTRDGWIKNWNRDTKRLINIFKEYWEIETLNFSVIEKELLPPFRKSNFDNKFNMYFALTWYQKAKIISKNISVKSYDGNLLSELAENLHRFTTYDEGVKDFLKKIEECGVKFFILDHLEHTYIDGASFFSQNNPVIVYTGRYDRVDNFWFTMAHEISHVLFHLENNKSNIIIDTIEGNSGNINEQEKEANEYACKLLRIDSIYKYFQKSDITLQNIRKYSEEYDIGVASVVGALKFNGLIPYKGKKMLTPKVSDKIPKCFYAKL